jgi:myo-inositol-1-phosphate synthase
MYFNFVGYKISDIHPVVAFNIDSRKLGKHLSEAIFAELNYTLKLSNILYLLVKVLKGPVLDTVSEELANDYNSQIGATIVTCIVAFLLS